MQEAIEPQLEKYAPPGMEYLRSGSTHVPEMILITDGLTEDWTQIELSPRVLGDIDCHLVICGRETPEEIEIRLSILPDGKERYNAAKPGMVLGYGKRSRLVIGSIDNRTNQTIGKVNKIELPPLRNISGILAPYEDAFCQAIANKTRKPVRRTVSTEKGPTSRFVKNYLLRGYNQRPESDETYQSLFKDFPPE